MGRTQALPLRPPEVTRDVFEYQTLIALMLSSQTKDPMVRSEPDAVHPTPLAPTFMGRRWAQRLFGYAAAWDHLGYQWRRGLAKARMGSMGLSVEARVQG